MSNLHHWSQLSPLLASSVSKRFSPSPPCLLLGFFPPPGSLLAFLVLSTISHFNSVWAFCACEEKLLSPHSWGELEAGEESKGYNISLEIPGKKKTRGQPGSAAPPSLVRCLPGCWLCWSPPGISLWSWEVFPFFATHTQLWKVFILVQMF